MPLPTFVIAGAQKSGTTTLHDLLSQLPDAWMTEPKEVHFFDRHLDRGIDWYAGQFHPEASHHAWGESTPYYLYSDSARRAMAERLPESLFVMLLREPVSRAYSQYWFARSKGVETLPTFAEAVAAEPERLAKSRNPRPARFSYLDRGRYLRQLQDLEDRVGRERLQIHLMDDLAKNPHEVLRSTCSFVGLDPAGATDVNARAKNTFANRTVNSADRLAKEPVARRADSVPAGSYPPIDSELAAHLRRQFAADNERLALWLGRDLSAWMP